MSDKSINTTKTHNKPTRLLVRIALSAVIITVCSWLTIPFTIPFTMQTFAIFFVLILLGGKWGTVAISVYVLLGVVGVPVFSGFKGGVGAILGATGGYIFGFILSGAIYWVLPFKEKSAVNRFIACFIALLACYICGTLWFAFVYMKEFTFEAILTALTVCVLPYIAVDIIKIILAELLGARLKPLIVA